MQIAALWDTSVGYTEYGGNITIETNRGRVIVISRNTFDYLYFRLDDFTAAMKEDCIRYTEYDDYVELENHMGLTKNVDYVEFHRNYDTELGE